MQMMPKHDFSPVIDRPALYATGVTRIQGVVLRRIGECGYFRSRDKDGGHTIRSAVAENPLLYANFTAVSFINWSYCRLEFHISGTPGIGNFTYFCEK